MSNELTGECVKEAKGKKTEGEYVKCSAGRKICQIGNVKTLMKDST